MKKFTAILLAIMLTVTSFGITSNVFAEGESTVKSKLPNTYAKMQKGGEIRVGYFGGSVTNGYGVDTSKGYTQDKDSWRGKSLKWLNDTYSATYNCTFTEEYHAGLGGTGTDFNLYRAQRALCENYPVDLLFIEFSINDSYKGGSPYDKSAYYMESIIRNVRTNNPSCDIVVVLTTDNDKLREADIHHMNGQAHADVAEHYGVPYIWLGDYMSEFLKAQYNGVVPHYGAALWKEYYMDGCHPNQNGYTKYFEFLRDNILKPNLDTNSAFDTDVVDYTLPANNYNTTEKFLSQYKKYSGKTTSGYYNAPLRTNAYDIHPQEIKNSSNSYNISIASTNTANPFRVDDVTISTAGASFRAVFNSKSAGMYFKGHTTNGAIQYRVDGGEWQSHDMYRSSNDTHEHVMFYENLKEKEHTVDVILRKTVKGSNFTFRGFFVDGDSAKAGVSFSADIPNKEIINEIFYVPITIAYDALNQKVSNTNTGTTFEITHPGVYDADTLSFTPNSASSDVVASSTANTALNAVTLPLYKYALIDYYYDLSTNETPANVAGGRQMLDFSGIGDSSLAIYSADKIVEKQISKSLVDLTSIGYRLGYTGALSQMHLYPYGNKKGNELDAGEIMHIRGVTFYTDYPYEDEAVIDVDVNKTVNTAGTTVDLSDVRVLPSAHRFATIKYSCAADTEISLRFDNDMYNSVTGKNDGSYTVSKAIKTGQGEVTIDLTSISKSGQIYYYKDVDIFAKASVTVESISFSLKHADTNAKFITFDANGGEGVLPEAIAGSIDEVIPLPDANLTKGNQIFIGWGETPDATKVITEATVALDGTTVYAIYATAAEIRYDANGGEGMVPLTVKAIVGSKTTLVDAELTRDAGVFIGWNTDKNATTALTSITVPEDGITVYAIYKQLETVYVTTDGTGKLTYNGVQYDAQYTTLQAAVSALGANGGKVVFNGQHSASTFASAQNSAAPLLIIEGADVTAEITLEGTYKLQCNTEFKNVAFIKLLQSGKTDAWIDVYFDGNGKKLVLGDNVAIYNELYSGNSNAPHSGERGAESLFKGYMRGADSVINSGKISNYFGNGVYFSGTTSGNISATLNGGIYDGGHYTGGLKFGEASFIHNGNITTTVNGGTWTVGANLRINRASNETTNVTGATAIIINNNLDAKYGFNIEDYNYILKSQKGGKATLAAEGSATVAPTFLLKADNPNMSIYINGKLVDSKNGEYLFRPILADTYVIAYVAGDIDANGVVDENDFALMRKALLGKISTDGDAFNKYDVNADGKINIADLVYVSELIAENAPRVIYEDGFNGTSLDSSWKKSTAGSAPTVSNGALQPGMVSGTNFTGKSILRPKATEAALNQFVEIDFQRNDPAAYSFGPGVFVRTPTDQNLQWGDSYYRVQVRLAHASNNPNAYDAYMYIYKAGDVKVGDQYGLVGYFDPNAEYRLKVSATSNVAGTETTIVATLYQINADGTLTQRAQISGTDTTAAMQKAGTVGLSYEIYGLSDATKSGIDIYNFKYSTSD